MTITAILRNPDVPERSLNFYMSGTYTAASVTNSLLTTTNADLNGFTVQSGGVTTTLRQNVVIASGVATFTIGFTPRKVVVENVTQRIKKEWYEGMNATDNLWTVAAGTKTLVTDSGVLVTLPTTTGSAPVTYEPGPITVTVTFATGTAIVTDNDTWVMEIYG